MNAPHAELHPSTGARSSRAGWQRRAGFSLLEIMLILVIIAMSAVVMVAAYQTGMQKARFREAGRVVQMMNKRARSLAIVKQVHMQVRYDTDNGVVELLQLSDQRQQNQSAIVALGIDVGSQDSLMYDEDETAQERDERIATAGGTVLYTKDIPVGIQLTEFSSETDVFEEGVYRVDFWPTGYVQGHEIYVEDPERLDEGDKAARMKITIENITGDVSIEEEAY